MLSFSCKSSLRGREGGSDTHFEIIIRVDNVTLAYYITPRLLTVSFLLHQGAPLLIKDFSRFLLIKILFDCHLSALSSRQCQLTTPGLKLAATLELLDLSVNEVTYCWQLQRDEGNTNYS